ncbi:MAG: hypothetical protein ACYDCN_02525 [Bacteroidia bacterium]
MQGKYAIHIHKECKPDAIKKGLYLVLTHANYIPPHVGLLIDTHYHSLGIGGQELNIKRAILLRTISMRKIHTIFIQLKKHPVFSSNHLNETFIEQVKLFDEVNEHGNTCLSPIRLFFEEFYAIPKERIKLVFDLLTSLKENDFMETTYGINLGKLKENTFYLQTYDETELKKRIIFASVFSKI